MTNSKSKRKLSKQTRVLTNKSQDLQRWASLPSFRKSGAPINPYSYEKGMNLSNEFIELQVIQL